MIKNDFALFGSVWSSSGCRVRSNLIQEVLVGFGTVYVL